MSKDYRYQLVDFLSKNKESWDDLGFWKKYLSQTWLSENTTEVALRIVNKRKVTMKLLPGISEEEVELLFAGCSESCLKWLVLARTVVVEDLIMEKQKQAQDGEDQTPQQQQVTIQEISTGGSPLPSVGQRLQHEQPLKKFPENQTTGFSSQNDSKSIEKAINAIRWYETDDEEPLKGTTSYNGRDDIIELVTGPEEGLGISNKIESSKLPKDIQFNRKPNSTNGEWIERLDKIIKRATLSPIIV